MLFATPRSIATRNRALYLTLLLFIQPCVGPCEWSAIDIGSKSDIKRSPFSISATDLKWSVARYKPRDLVTNEKLEAVKGDKRLVFRGKGEGLSNFAEFGGLRGRGKFSLGSTFALDETRGLRSGETSAWVYANYLDDVTSTRFQINLDYDEALSDGEGTVPGWTARATSEGKTLGTCDFPGYASVDVRLVQFADRLEFLARGTPMAGYGEGDAEAESFKMVHSETMGQAPDGFQIGFGAFGLDKKGEVFMDMLWFLGPDLGPEPDSDEVFAFNSFSRIGSCLGAAKSALTVSESNPTIDLLDIQEARDQVADARSQATSAMFEIKDDIKDGNFDPQTAAKTAGKIAKKTYKTLHSIENKLQKMLDNSEVKTSQLKGICKKLSKLMDSSVVGRANMLGVNVKKLKQLEKISYPIDMGALPDIFED